MIIGVLVLLMYFLPTQRELMVTSAKHILKLDTPNLANAKITVYQSQGHKGEAFFSDRQNMARTAHARVVDNAKGTTTHTDVPKKEEKTSVLNFDEENARFQKQAQMIQQARIERAIGE